MEYTRFLSTLSEARRASPIRAVQSLYQLGPASTISLAGGMPHPKFFPFESLEIKLKDGTEFTLEGEKLNTSLQYSNSVGLTALLHQLRQLQDHVHHPITKYDVMITTGSQEALFMSIAMLTNPGDAILVDKLSYEHTLTGMIEPYNLRVLELDLDDFGITVESLEHAMSSWGDSDIDAVGSDIPKYIYTMPINTNCTKAWERKKLIYKVAQKYNLVILENDPHFYTQYSEQQSSFLSLDTDGRVLRIDSFSSTISPGLRIGMATGPAEFIEKIMFHVASSSQHSSALSQVILLEIFQRWSVSGFLQHSKRITAEHNADKESILKYINTHMKDDVDILSPSSGPYIWMQLKNSLDVTELIDKAYHDKILLLGSNMRLSDSSVPSAYVRIAYAGCVDSGQTTKALKRLKVLMDELHANHSSV